MRDPSPAPEIWQLKTVFLGLPSKLADRAMCMRHLVSPELASTIVICSTGERERGVGDVGVVMEVGTVAVADQHEGKGERGVEEKRIGKKMENVTIIGFMYLDGMDHSNKVSRSMGSRNWTEERGTLFVRGFYKVGRK